MKTTTATDTRIKTTPTMRAILVAALDANNRVCIPSHAAGYKGHGTAIKGLRERGYVHNVPADVEGCYWPTLTPAGIEKARALRAAMSLGMSNALTQQVYESAIVWVQGHEMIASDVRWNGDTVSFVGACTPHSCNDGIRETGYNGARYQGNSLVYTKMIPVPG